MKALLLSALLAAPCSARAAVLVIGVDGLDPSLAGEMAAAGRLPAIAAVLKDGAGGTLLAGSTATLSSPVIWTSMATGAGAEKHGITGFVKPGGGWFRSGDRGMPALWNMASSRGRTAGVVGWLMTYPAEPVSGVMVSNNYFMAVGTHSVVYPEGLALRTPRGFEFENGGGYALAARLAGAELPPMFPFMPPLGSYGSREFRLHYVLEKLADYALADEGFTRIGEELLERGGFDLFMLYLPGVDRVSHLAWGPHAAAATGRADDFAGLARAYYSYVDGLIGRLLAKAGPADTVVVVSDHGFKVRAGAGPRTVVTGDHRPGGFFAARGPSIKRGATLAAPLYDRDIAPTVLYLLGLPAARVMDGRPAAEIFSGGVLSEREPEYIDAYPLPEPSRERKDLPFTPQELERLRLSGYLQ